LDSSYYTFITASYFELTIICENLLLLFPNAKKIFSEICGFMLQILLTICKS